MQETQPGPEHLAPIDQQERPGRPSRTLTTLLRAWAVVVSLLLALPTVAMVAAGAAGTKLRRALGAYLPQDELLDRAIWMAMLAIPVVLVGPYAWAAVRRRGLAAVRLPRVVDSLGLGLIVVGFVVGVTIRNPYGQLDGRAWFGFGWPVFLGACAVSVALARLVLGGWRGLAGRCARTTEVALWLVAAVVYLPALLQPPAGLIDTFHSDYVISEALGPLAGRGILVDQAPQYSALVGALLLPLRATGLTNSWVRAQPDLLVTLLLCVLAVATVVLLVLLVRSAALPSGWRFLPSPRSCRWYWSTARRGCRRHP